MRYEISVDGQLLMSVRYIADAEWFIRDRMSHGMQVRVRDTKTGRDWAGDAKAPSVKAEAA